MRERRSVGEVTEREREKEEGGRERDGGREREGGRVGGWEGGERGGEGDRMRG